MKATLIIFAVFFVVVEQLAFLNAGTIFFLKNSCKRVMKNGIQAQNYSIDTCTYILSFVRSLILGTEAKRPYFLLRFEPEDVLNMFLF